MIFKIKSRCIATSQMAFHIKTYCLSDIRVVECHRNPASLKRQKISSGTSQISRKRVTSQDLKVSAKLQVASFYIKIASCKLRVKP